MLTVDFCKLRQVRLLQVIQRRKLDAILVGLPAHVYYLSGFLPSWLHQAAMIVFADGRSALISPNTLATGTAAGEVRSYEANWFSTLRQEQPMAIADIAVELLSSRRATSIGIDASSVSSQVAMSFDGSPVSIDPELWQLRRRKDPDELDLMKTAIRCCEAMYVKARELIAPGVAELDVFNALSAVAVEVAGESMGALLGNDFACGAPGGPARKDRRAAAGELYILDLGPVYRGYFSDNARTISVDRKSTDAQSKAWSDISAALTLVEKTARPGVRGAELFDLVDQHFKECRNSVMTHHLGHGVGLQPHEYPHLNPKWDDVLLEGEVFTAEPGQYSPELRGGIRLENQYLVTTDGVINLVNAPLELVA
jgi:Xaa-Pro dipeptidase